MSTKGYFCIYIAVFQHRTNNRYTVDIVGGVIKHKQVNILIQSCLPSMHQPQPMGVCEKQAIDFIHGQAEHQ